MPHEQEKPLKYSRLTLALVAAIPAFATVAQAQTAVPLTVSLAPPVYDAVTGTVIFAIPSSRWRVSASST